MEKSLEERLKAMEENKKRVAAVRRQFKREYVVFIDKDGNYVAVKKEGKS
jgi:hypothetical protein